MTHSPDTQADARLARYIRASVFGADQTDVGCRDPCSGHHGSIHGAIIISDRDDPAVHHSGASVRRRHAIGCRKVPRHGQCQQTRRSPARPSAHDDDDRSHL